MGRGEVSMWGCPKGETSSLYCDLLFTKLFCFEGLFLLTFLQFQVVRAGNVGDRKTSLLLIGEAIAMIHIYLYSDVCGVRTLGSLARYDVTSIGVQDDLIRSGRLTSNEIQVRNSYRKRGA